MSDPAAGPPTPWSPGAPPRGLPMPALEAIVDSSSGSPVLATGPGPPARRASEGALPPASDSTLHAPSNADLRQASKASLHAPSNADLRQASQASLHAASPPARRRGAGGSTASSLQPRRSPAVRHWTPQMEAIAIHTKRQATGYAWMYARMATNSKRLGGGLNVTSGILGILSGSSGALSYFGDAGWAAICGMVIGAVIAIIAFLVSFWELNGKPMQLTLTQSSFSILAKDLMFQLAQPRRDRPDAREYIKAKLSEIEQLKASSMLIDGTVQTAYNNKFRDNPIYSDIEPLSLEFTDRDSDTDMSVLHDEFAPPDDGSSPTEDGIVIGDGSQYMT